MPNKLKRLKDMVEKTLAEQPLTRNDDVLLLLSIRNNFFGVKTVFGNMIIGVNKFYKLPNLDDVKRIRVRFNQLGFYITDDPNVLKKRKRGMHHYKKFLEYA